MFCLSNHHDCLKYVHYQLSMRKGRHPIRIALLSDRPLPVSIVERLNFQVFHIVRNNESPTGPMNFQVSSRTIHFQAVPCLHWRSGRKRYANCTKISLLWRRSLRASQARNSSPTPSERNILPIPTSEGKSLQYEGKEGTLNESYDLPDEVKQGL